MFFGEILLFLDALFEDLDKRNVYFYRQNKIINFKAGWKIKICGKVFNRFFLTDIKFIEILRIKRVLNSNKIKF